MRTDQVFILVLTVMSVVIIAAMHVHSQRHEKASAVRDSQEPEKAAEATAVRAQTRVARRR